MNFLAAKNSNMRLLFPCRKSGSGNRGSGLQGNRGRNRGQVCNL